MWKFQYFLLLLMIYFINNAEGLKCYKCDSAKGNPCVDDLTQLKPEECAADEDSCFTTYFFGTIRGCKAKKSKHFSKVISECDQDGCNTHIFCYECDSAVTSRCKGFSKTPVCPGEKDKCMIWVKDDKLIERRCVNSSFNCEENKTKTCHICNTSLCNSLFDLFPEDRRLCYQCSENNNETCELSVKPLPCKFYDENEKCYSIGTSPMSMEYGCMSDIGHQCSGETCLTCGSNGCNNRPYFRNASRKCFQCGLKDINCSKEALPCKNPIEYWKQSEECFIQTVSGKIIQGCVNDRGTYEEPCTAENSCKICDTDGCNIKDVNDENHSDQDFSGAGSGNGVYPNYASGSNDIALNFSIQTMSGRITQICLTQICNTDGCKFHVDVNNEKYPVQVFNGENSGSNEIASIRIIHTVGGEIIQGYVDN